MKDCFIILAQDWIVLKGTQSLSPKHDVLHTWAKYNHREKCIKSCFCEGAITYDSQPHRVLQQRVCVDLNILLVFGYDS